MSDNGASEPTLKLRIAKPSDAAGLAEVYLTTASKLPGAFLTTLGHTFLACYHRILIAEPSSIVICLEDQKGRIVGFASGTCAMEEHVAALSRKRVQLVLSSLPAIASRPATLAAMYRRFQATRHCKQEEGFVVGQGPRLEYWGCIEGAVAPGEAIELMRSWLAIFRRLGGSRVSFEVDSSNDKVLRIHKAFGATVERRFITGDGRERFILKYELNDERIRRRIDG